ncbi:hypothetical protein PILCRDRAFT_48037, partial [Piloderma croceum F 1598]
MYFTLYGYQTYTLTLNLLHDLKLSQYTGLPPCATFTVQVVGGVIGGLLNYVIMKLVLAGNCTILLDIQGSNVWSGQQVDAISWGALAKPLYAPGAHYGFVPWMMIAGLGAPIPTWILHCYYPKFRWNHVFMPILV